jgi:glycine dehydrogenase
VGQLAGAKYGSASILPISYSYIGQLGKGGVRKCTVLALLNANYMMKQLEGEYPILYQG